VYAAGVGGPDTRSAGFDPFVSPRTGYGGAGGQMIAWVRLEEVSSYGLVFPIDLTAPVRNELTTRMDRVSLPAVKFLKNLPNLIR
jgi:hypothetical protein